MLKIYVQTLYRGSLEYAVRKEECFSTLKMRVCKDLDWCYALVRIVAKGALELMAI